MAGHTLVQMYNLQGIISAKLIKQSSEKQQKLRKTAETKTYPEQQQQGSWENPSSFSTGVLGNGNQQSRSKMPSQKELCSQNPLNHILGKLRPM